MNLINSNDIAVKIEFIHCYVWMKNFLELDFIGAAFLSASPANADNKLLKMEKS